MTSAPPPKFERHSLLTCPECGASEMLEMPTDACLWFHECPECGVMLKPRKGDCCVFCSYGSVPCPPVQTGGCSGAGP
ncbi:MAG: GDCCVxC domain-containing (seleno)protein [Alphaproteobacteria bacterium]|nr:GDCCVxC domain-containing (seleno)protein [Alphaproteobacteria bacterium]